MTPRLFPLLLSLALLGTSGADDNGSPELLFFHVAKDIPDNYTPSQVRAKLSPMDGAPSDSSFVVLNVDGAAYATELMFLVETQDQAIVARGRRGGGLSLVGGPGLEWSWGAEHVYLDKLKVFNYRFAPDPEYPITMKLVPGKGYVYLCGRGTITGLDGRVTRVGHQYTAGDWVPLLDSTTQLEREAAAQALGWLVESDAELSVSLPPLMAALKDEAMEVRRNAAEALGRIADTRSIASLKVAIHDRDEWVREVATEALANLGEEVITNPGVDKVTSADIATARHKLSIDGGTLASYAPWYFVFVQDKIAAVWRPTVSTGQSAEVSASFRIQVQTDGMVGAVELLRSSGRELYDREAMRAIRESSPFPPLPEELTDAIEITLTFTERQ